MSDGIGFPAPYDGPEDDYDGSHESFQRILRRLELPLSDDDVDWANLFVDSLVTDEVRSHTTEALEEIGHLEHEVARLAKSLRTHFDFTDAALEGLKILEAVKNRCVSVPDGRHGGRQAVKLEEAVLDRWWAASGLAPVTRRYHLLVDVLELAFEGTVAEQNEKLVALTLEGAPTDNVVPIGLAERVAGPSDGELLVGIQLDMERRGLRRSTVNGRLRKLKLFQAWLAPRSLLDASREDVDQYLDSRSIGTTARRNYLSHFATFYRWAIAQGFLEVAPTAAIVPPRRDRRLPRPIADADLARALTEAVDQRLRCFIVLGAYAGLRCQEIAGLEVSDVDRTAGLLKVRNGKGGKQRTVPLHPEIVRELDRLPMPASGPVFRLYVHGGDGRTRQQTEWQPRPHTVSHQINNHLKRIGVEASAHQLRHWFASKTYQASQDLRLTQELLGHTDPATTAIYAAFDTTKAAPTVCGLQIHDE